MSARNIGVVTMVIAVALLMTVSNGGIFGGGEALAGPPCQITTTNLLNVNFKCYTIAKGTNPGIGPVTLEDQFDSETVTVRESQLICTPANKTVGETADGAFFDQCPFFHLKCYNIVPAKPALETLVTVIDQFETEHGVKVQAAQYLCEGAFKNPE